MPVYTAQEASWIARANAAVDGRRHMSDEELTEVITAEDPPFKLRNSADWLMKMGKTMEQKENKKNDALAQEKVSRGELIMSLMGFCTVATHNQLMVYTMAMMKVLESKGLVTKDEIRAQIAEFAKSDDKKEEVIEEPDAAAVMADDAPIGNGIEEAPDEPLEHKLVDFPPSPTEVN